MQHFNRSFILLHSVLRNGAASIPTIAVERCFERRVRSCEERHNRTPVHFRYNKGEMREAALAFKQSEAGRGSKTVQANW